MPDLAELTLQVNSTGVAQANLRLNDFGKSAGVAEKAAAGFTSGWGVSTLMLAKLAGLLSVTTLAWKAMQAASQRQDQLNVFTALTGSAEKAVGVVQDLRRLTDKIPFSMDGLADVTMTLTGLGTEAKDVARDVAAIADAAAATGRGAAGFHLMAGELGRIREQGEVSNRELRVFVRMGVPIWDFISEKLGVTVPDAMNRARRGALNAEVTYDAIIEGMEKKFGGLAEKRATSFTGAWEVAKNRITNILADIGEGFNKGVDWSHIFDRVTSILRVSGQVAADALRIFMGYPPVFSDTAGAAQKVADILQVIVNIFKLWVGIQIVVIIEKMALNMILFAKSMGTASIAANPLLATVLAVGVAIASWSIGQTLYDQFKWVQRAAENVRHIVASTFSAGGENKGKPGHRGYDPYGQYPDEEEQSNTPMSREQALHDQVMKDINNAPEAEGTLGSNFMKNFNDNIATASGNMQETFGKAFGGLSPELAEQLKMLTGEYEKLTDTRNKGIHTAEDEAKAQERDLEPIKAIIEKLKDEQKFAGLNTVEKEKAQAVDKVSHLLDGTRITDRQKYIDLVKKEIDATARLNAEGEISRAIKTRTREAETFSLHGDELEKELAYRQLVNKAIEDGVTLDDKFLAGIRAQSNALVDVKLRWEQVWTTAQQVGDAWGQAFDDAISGSKDLRTAFGDMLKEIQKDIIHNFVTAPISKMITQAVGNALGGLTSGTTGGGFNWASLFGSVGSSLGGAYGGNPSDGTLSSGGGGYTSQPIIRSAMGNVFDRPTTSLFGEAGPEAVVPLQRGRDGKLGIAGGGGNSVTINVYTPDANSFKKSQRQIMENVRRSIQ